MMTLWQRSLPGGVLIGAVTFMATIAATQAGLASWMISPITAGLAAYVWIQFRQRSQDQRRRPRSESVEAHSTSYSLVDAATTPTATPTAAHRDDLASLQAELTAAETRSRQLAQQLQTAQQDLKHQQTTLTHLREQLQARTQHLAELQTEYAQLATQNQDLSTQATTYQAVETALTEIQAEATQLQQKVTEYEEYIPFLEADLVQKEQQLNDFTQAEQTELANLAMENARLQRELGQYAAQHEQDTRADAPVPDNTTADLNGTSPHPPYSFDIQCYDDLQAVNQRHIKSVLTKIFDLQYTPRPQDCETVKKYKYKAQKLYRIKSGRYRICYAVEDSPKNRIQILMVDNRTEGIYDAELARRLGY